MPVTFISNNGSIPAGTIILWYGTKAAIPPGWAYYAEAAGYWVKGGTTVNTTPQNTAAHSHTYSADSGLAGAHNHAFTVSASAATSAQVLKDDPLHSDVTATMPTHGHTTVNVGTIGTDPNHSHDILPSGATLLAPASVGIYYIKRTL